MTREQKSSFTVAYNEHSGLPWELLSPSRVVVAVYNTEQPACSAAEAMNKRLYESDSLPLPS